ncbi:MAG: hypothetical protein R3A48_14605 [Polyangiales bacterium]
MTRARAALLCSMILAGCAEGTLDGLEGDAAITGTPAEPDATPEDLPAAGDDAFVIPVEDTPAPFDAGWSELDVGATPDASAPFEDLVSPTLDAVTLDAPAADVVTPDSPRVDAPAADVGVSCAAPRLSCGGRCVDVSSDPANCGSCGAACSGATPMCAAGRCAAPSCGAGASDCDSNTANGCELSHRSSEVCASAPNLGSWCGDVACGFLCPSNSSRVVATRTGRASAWFRGRTNECSNCPARLDVTFTLTVPAGVDYDLYVYESCGGAPIGRSLLLQGQTDRVNINRSGDFGSDSFNWWVEVRYVSGGSCAPWTLTVQTRSNSASSC